MMYLPLVWINGRTGQIDGQRSIAQSITSPDNGTTFDVTLKEPALVRWRADHQCGCRLYVPA